MMMMRVEFNTLSAETLTHSERVRTKPNDEQLHQNEWKLLVCLCRRIESDCRALGWEEKQTENMMIDNINVHTLHFNDRIYSLRVWIVELQISTGVHKQRGEQNTLMWKGTDTKKILSSKLFITIYSMQIEVNRYKLRLTLSNLNPHNSCECSVFHCLSFPVKKSNKKNLHWNTRNLKMQKNRVKHEPDRNKIDA